MEKITNFKDFQTYIDLSNWCDNYNNNYGKCNIEKPKLSEKMNFVLSNNNNSLIPSSLSYGVFYKIMLSRLTELVPNYIVDDNNKQVIEEISKFATKHGNYANVIKKGFIIMGGTGTGKTKILTAFLDIIRKYFKMSVSFSPSYKYVEDFTKYQYDGSISNLSIMKAIDDLGSENLYNNYGVTTNVILEFIYRAYDAKVICFATTNLDPKSLSKFYGDRGYSRMIEMLYFFTLNGGDKRK